MVTLTIEDSILQYGVNFLHAKIEPGNYDEKLMCSRRILLLSALVWIIAVRLLESVVVTLAASVTILITLMNLFISGVIFSVGEDGVIWCTIADAASTTTLNINKPFYHLQDKPVSWLIKPAVLTDIRYSPDQPSV